MTVCDKVRTVFESNFELLGGMIAKLMYSESRFRAIGLVAADSRTQKFRPEI